MNRVYHFLGGVYFAIFLIASIACFVAAGTFLESVTESHRYASLFTYDNPLFTLLLSCLFVNILFSAMRRYPFKIKHIPFLITHLGLLMILTGVFIKNFLGTQGTMLILEGSSTEEITLANRYEILMESRTDKAKFTLERPEPLDGVKIKVASYTPHANEEYETAIKGDHLFIVGMKPLPLGLEGTFSGWKVIGHISENPEELVQEAYFKKLLVTISDTQSQEILFQGDCEEAKQHVDLKLQLTPPCIQARFTDGSQNSIPLSGSESLKNHVAQGSYLKSPLYTLDFQHEPTLLFIKQNTEDTLVYALDAHGRILSQTLNHSALSAYIAYESGFSGYSVPLSIPHEVAGRKEIEDADSAFLKNNLRESLQSHQTLSPPLQLYKTYCDEYNLDFPNACIDFLERWHKGRQLVCEVKRLKTIDGMPERDLQACHWISILFQEIEPRLSKGEDLLHILADMDWPLLDALKESKDDLLDTLTHQIYAVADELPKPPVWNYPGILSAYFRLYGIQFHTISPMIKRKEPQELTLECPLSICRTQVEPGKKLEDNRPAVTLLLDDGVKKELLALSYEKAGGGLKWPALGASYLFRFQPQSLTIPFNVRLRNARQINYPGTSQAYSYESDLIITDTRDGTETERTISMNNVHETWDGYRFYLANITPGTETAIQHVQIAVNHDPAKYLVTYPGAAISSLGILLLFWMRPYGRRYF